MQLKIVYILLFNNIFGYPKVSFSENITAIILNAKENSVQIQYRFKNVNMDCRRFCSSLKQ